MNLCPTDFARLSLLVQRLLDAEVLMDADGEALVAAAEAARRSLEAGDGKATCGYVEQVARLAEALLSADALAAVEGRSVLEAIRRLLDGS